MIRAHILVLWLVGNALGAGALRAGDVAFWKPYQSDPHTHLLLQFEKGLSEIEGTAKIDKVELLGDATFEDGGKFGRGLRVQGNGTLRVTPTAVFPGAYLAVEAWVKLDRYPAKEASVVFRPAVVDRSSVYDPQHDRTKGFALLIDAQGALHLETTNCYYGKTTRTSSPAGAVPLNQWVHVAGVSDAFPVAFRRLFVDGREVRAQPVEWGEGLMVSGDEEQQPGPIYVANNDQGKAGLAGWIDQVRIHTGIVKFWERDDLWPAQFADRLLHAGPPYFLEEHQCSVHLPLDGDLTPTVNRVPALQVRAEGDRYVPAVRGKGWHGPLRLSASELLNLNEGAIELWLQPMAVNNYADPNRSFISGPFTLYFFNSGGLGLKPMTLYFHTGERLHFVRDELATEFHPGTWYHVLIAWKGKTIFLYINGRQAGKTVNQGLATAQNKGICSELDLSPHAPIGVLDEIRLYRRALLPEEANNAYARYREPERLIRNVRARSVELTAWFLPSQRKIVYRLAAEGAVPPQSRVRLTLLDGADREILRTEVPLAEGRQELEVPDLPDGAYRLSSALVRPDGRGEPGETFAFLRKRFPWENNALGITEEVYPPFEPIRVSGNDVQVIHRCCAMNGFGLWDKAVSLGRDLLAAPMCLRLVTAEGDARFAKSSGRWATAKPPVAVYEAEASAETVRIQTRSTIEVDGCMKVEMQLAPGPKPAEIRSLWIEIPLKAGEVPLMHTIGDGLRSNFAGHTPQGAGTVWDGSKAVRSGLWRNCFTPYVWLGAEERGLTWFAENDRGWSTEKHKSRKPTHELLRQGDQVVLRVYLVNRPITLTEPRRLCFGLQASPTKPLPADWRKRLPGVPAGLAVVPFGGLECASQGPLGDDWSVVDKILACRAGSRLDEAWLADYVNRHRPPLVHGTWTWSSSVGHFAARARDVGPTRPLTVYQEEMYASSSRPEYAVFQDEWDGDLDAHPRVSPDFAALAQGYRALGKPVAVTFGPSYRDFGCWFADQWLRRGVSLYWDNTYPHLATNPQTSDAYLAEDGQVQPCLILWNQREYQKRVWHLLQQWRHKRPEPLEWVLHMTNTLVLPIHTWGTANLDHELGRDDPFPPDWLRTETIGRQVGNLPMSLYAVCGAHNKTLARLAEKTPKAELDRLRERVEWGMRAVHEIQRTGPLEKHLTDFGYADGQASIGNYWDPSPAILVAPQTVKWIVLVDRARRRALVVLSSWSEEKARAEIVLDPRNLGFSTGEVADAETGEVLAPGPPGTLTVELSAPYGVRLLRLQGK